MGFMRPNLSHFETPTPHIVLSYDYDYMTSFPRLAKSLPAFDIHQQWGSKLAYNPVKAGFMFAFCIFV